MVITQEIIPLGLEAEMDLQETAQLHRQFCGMFVWNKFSTVPEGFQQPK